MSVIENIETFENGYKWLGYKITMSNPDTNIIAKISNSLNCCESWGIYTKAKFEDFIGATYQDVNISDVEYDGDMGSICEMRSIYLTIITDRGDIVLQFYNEHNGYYQHDVSVESIKGVQNIWI